MPTQVWPGRLRYTWSSRPQEASRLYTATVQSWHERVTSGLIRFLPGPGARAGLAAGQEWIALSPSRTTLTRGPATASPGSEAVGSSVSICGQLWSCDPSTEAAVHEPVGETGHG